MTWLAILATALAAFAVIALLQKRPHRGWAAIAVALLAGLTGYAVQGRPDLAGAPKQFVEAASGEEQAMIQARWELTGRQGPLLGSFLIMADADMRGGNSEGAATILNGMVARQPGHAEAWVALGNALVAHADGALTPAALHAYRRSAEVAPHYAAPPFFLGLALARNGRLDEARAMWAGLLERTPADVAWRPGLADRVAQLDAFIAEQQAAGGDSGP